MIDPAQSLVLLTVGLALLTAVACTPHNDRVSGASALVASQDTMEDYQPTSVIGLLRKLRAAPLDSTFFRADFYSRDALRAFFGAADIRLRRSSTSRDLVGTLSSFSFAKATGGEALDKFAVAMTVDTTSQRDQISTVLLRGSLRLSEERIAYEQLVEIFGAGRPQQMDGFPMPSTPHANHDRPSHPQGNQTLEFDFSDSSYIKIGTFDFRADGTVHFFSIKFAAKGGR